MPVTVRFSNGSGCAVDHDGWSDVRGMATRFHLSKDETTDLANGATTDLIAMTLPEFFTPTPETFLDFAMAAKPAPVTRESPWRKILDMLRLMLPLPNPYPGENDQPQRRRDPIRGSERLRQARRVPGGHDRRAGELRSRGLSCRAHVRCRGAGRSAPLGPLQLATRRRRSEHQSRGDARRSISANGTARSPASRARAIYSDDGDRRGRRRFQRSLSPVAASSGPGHDGNADAQRRSRRPGRELRTSELQSLHLTAGIEPSDDPVLRVRQDAYKISAKRRLGAGCPFSGNVAEPAANGAGWFDRFVDGLPKNALVQFLSAKFLVPVLGLADADTALARRPAARGSAQRKRSADDEPPHAA